MIVLSIYTIQYSLFHLLVRRCHVKRKAIPEPIEKTKELDSCMASRHTTRKTAKIEPAQGAFARFALAVFIDLASLRRHGSQIIQFYFSDLTL